MPTSTAGTKRRIGGPPTPPRKGFTLIELTVVLAIIALATALAAPGLSRFLDPKPTPPPVDSFTAVLAQARDQAILKRSSFSGLFDPQDGSWRNASGDLLYQLPTDVQFHLAADSPEGPISCVFHPDGSGCPLQLELIDSSGDWLIRVDPVTGRIRQARILSGSSTDPS